MSDSDFKPFADKCLERGFPELSRMDDFMEFLDEFTGEIREQVTQQVRRDLNWNYHNPTMSRARGPDPDGDPDDRAEVEQLIDAAVREELRDAARKLAKLMDGIA